MIYHITTKQIWNFTKSKQSYTPENFKKDGFIHCSTKNQLPKILEKHFKGAKDLVILEIDETKVTAKIKTEDLYQSGEAYPHIYGELNKDAIVDITYLK